MHYVVHYLHFNNSIFLAYSHLRKIQKFTFFAGNFMSANHLYFWPYDKLLIHVLHFKSVSV